MKYVICIIQPSKLDAVREALTELNLSGMTVSEAQGYGRQHGKTEIYRGAEYSIQFLPKIKIELAIADDQEADVLDAISSTVKTGKIGDGKVFVLNLSHALRIRTGETDTDAL
ncbi:MAG: P-II family nitrogen regulator [Alphaproteobacteria bacterium]|nr:P-II family nitrogen regulator [Alphaproteobacteria bacterium]